MRTLITIAVFAFACLACLSCHPGASPSINSRNVSGTQVSSDMSSEEILTRVTEIVAEALTLRPDEVNVDAPLSKQKNPADDLDVIEIVMTVEHAYQIEIRDDEIGDLTVRKLSDIVIKRKQVSK